MHPEVLPPSYHAIWGFLLSKATSALNNMYNYVIWAQGLSRFLLNGGDARTAKAVQCSAKFQIDWVIALEDDRRR